MAVDPDLVESVGRRIRWLWKRLRRAGLALVPVGAREAVERDAMIYICIWLPGLQFVKLSAVSRCRCCVEGVASMRKSQASSIGVS